MLIITRKIGESISTNEHVHITVLDATGSQIHIGLSVFNSSLIGVSNDLES